jgi:hypothetical protein
MQFDQSPDQSQADSQTAFGAVDRRCNLREHREHFGEGMRIEADAVVLDRHRQPARQQLNHERNLPARVGVFRRVGQKIRHRLRQPQRVHLQRH